MYTIDASVWINASAGRESGTQISRQFLRYVQHNSTPLVLPTLLLVEIAGALSRSQSRPARAVKFATGLAATTYATFISLDQELANLALSIAAQYRLRGADAIYVAIAQRHNCTLITLDQEQLTRLTGVILTLTPTQALASLPPTS